jgi:hypothetical protein
VPVPFLHKTPNFLPRNGTPGLSPSTVMLSLQLIRPLPLRCHFVLLKSLTLSPVQCPPPLPGLFPFQVDCRAIIEVYSRKRHDGTWKQNKCQSFSNSYIGFQGTIFEPVGNLRGQKSIHWCWCYTQGSFFIASCAGSHLNRLIFASVIWAHTNMVIFHTNQQLGSCWCNNCIFSHVFFPLFPCG